VYGPFASRETALNRVEDGIRRDQDGKVNLG
jgi:hypothetical protein